MLGAGYATEVAVALVGFARTLGMRRVEATCHPSNVRSVRVLEKAGLASKVDSATICSSAGHGATASCSLSSFRCLGPMLRPYRGRGG